MHYFQSDSLLWLIGKYLAAGATQSHPHAGLWWQIFGMLELVECYSLCDFLCAMHSSLSRNYCLNYCADIVGTKITFNLWTVGSFVSSNGMAAFSAVWRELCSSFTCVGRSCECLVIAGNWQWLWSWIKTCNFMMKLSYTIFKFILCHFSCSWSFRGWI